MKTGRVAADAVPARRATIREVAEAAGVSRSTDRSQISPICPVGAGSP